MLDEYQLKLNKISDIELGTFKEDNINRSIRRYYKNYFENKDINLVVEEYLTGIQWILNYYYNDRIDKSWSYNNYKAPFIRDINEYLKNKKNYFKKIKENLNYKNDIFFTPIEQMMYIMPFDSNKIKKTDTDYNLIIFENLISKDQIDKIKLFIKNTMNDKNLKNFYFSLNQQVKEVYNKKIII